MNLAQLGALLPGTRLHGDASVVVSAVGHDSRSLPPGALFVAIRGLVADGNQFVDAALRKGAFAIASEAPPRPGVPWLQVKDARLALALFSAAVLGQPADALELVGVTGTNGKTTTTYLIDAALRAAGERVGLVGTIQYRIGDRLIESVRTTPEASDLQRLFAEMREAGCRYAVFEVSSHSLALKRVHGCSFRVAVFTNLTRDHLDFHGDMESYFGAKRILFESLLRTDGTAVINADDDHARGLREVSRGRVLSYGLRPTADITAQDVTLSLEGTRFRARTPAGDLDVRTPLLGSFNVQNVLAALAAGLALGIDAEAILRGIASLLGVPGRMERVDAGQDFAIIVDYAHTDDALRKLLETVRGLNPRRIITVFGCGGDRDRSKRPLMGAVAARLSDVVVVTSDNPRSEPPEAIIDEILLGMNGIRLRGVESTAPTSSALDRNTEAPTAGGRKGERHVVADRREAIARALELAQPGDAVVIAGKGHETTQTLRDRSVPFDDRQVAREALAREARSGQS